jgi:hypothetical protein
MALRNILPDLEERLNVNDVKGKAVETEYQSEKTALDRRYAEQKQTLDQERSLLLAMIDAERRRLGIEQDVTSSQPRSPLDDFLVEVLVQMGPKTRDDLHKLAAVNGYFVSRGDARTTHTTLLNVVRGGRIRQLDDGRFEAVEREAETRDLLQ